MSSSRSVISSDKMTCIIVYYVNNDPVKRFLLETKRSGFFISKDGFYGKNIQIQ